MSALFRPELGRIHHTAYLVDSIEATVASLVEQLGAGPFFALDQVPLEDLSSRGEPARFRHNSAFGFCGGDPIELMEILDTAPERVGARFAGPRPSFHHLAWVVPAASVDGVREELDRRGMPAYLQGHLNDIDLSYHDGSSSLGHDVEIHADCEGLQGFFTMFREAAEGWDGSDPIRPAMG